VGKIGMAGKSDLSFYLYFSPELAKHVYPLIALDESNFFITNDNKFIWFIELKAALTLFMLKVLQ
jgi:hypothetical protein